MMRIGFAFGGLAVAGVALIVGCSDTGGGGPLFQGAGGTAGAGATGGTAGGGTGASAGTGGSGAGPIIDAGSGTGATGGGSSCNAGPDEDFDKDGFSINAGDCNDCDANANPGAFDVAGNNVDEDCNGTPDDTVASCDESITDVGDTDPNNGARAIGLCHFATAADKKWGVLEAKYTLADGSPGMNPLSAGLLTAFGQNVNTQEGKRLLALSSGTARQPTDPGYQSVGGYNASTTSPQPPGFPIDTPACPGVTTGGNANDPGAIELKIRVPTNAKSFKFLFNFYTYEFPSFICSSFNDFFVALQNPAPPNAKQGNISFDSQGNPVSVNNGFLEVCKPQTAGGKTFPCSLGESELQGTGFEGHAATGWLETTSPVTPGSEITLRFMAYDVGDHILDSTVLLDKFQFSAEEATGSTTKPVPVPR